MDSITTFREAVHNYMDTFDAFQLFGSSHIGGALISLIVIIFVPWGAKKYLTPRQQSVLGMIIGYLVMANYLLWVVLELVAGTFDMRLHLPFHLCRLANLAMPLVMVYRRYRVYEILFFWGLSGVLQGTITPDIAADYPHFHYFRFWVGHNGLVLAVIYATVVYGMRPTGRSIWRAFVALNVFFVITIFVNLILDANYFWICGKPVNELGEHVPSLLDYMGHWPWYILTAEFVALLHFFLAYSPFYFIDRFRKRRTLSRDKFATRLVLKKQ